MDRSTPTPTPIQHEATVANADLWARYFQDQWSRWLDPFGVLAAAPVSQVAQGTAARVASFLTLVAAGPIAWMYGNAVMSGAASPRQPVPSAREDAAA